MRKKRTQIQNIKEENEGKEEEEEEGKGEKRRRGRKEGKCCYLKELLCRKEERDECSPMW